MRLLTNLATIQGATRAAALLGTLALGGFSARAATTTLVSAIPDGTATGNGVVKTPVFSPDGRKIAFLSAASNLTAQSDVNNADDVFVRDLTTGVTTLVSAIPDGSASGSGASGYTPVWSPDSSKLLFVSVAPDLTSQPDGNGTTFTADVFLRDLNTNVTTLVSVSPDGLFASNESVGAQPAFSPDGRKVGYVSYATNLTGVTDTGTFADVFVRDLTTGVTTLISASLDGTAPGNEDTTVFLFSPDSRKIAFVGSPTNFVLQNNINGNAPDIFVRDLAGGGTVLVSVSKDGMTTGTSSAANASFSPDSRKLAFTSTSTNISTETDTNAANDVFVRDLAGATTVTASVTTSGTTGNGTSTLPVWSPDSSKLGFSSGATNLTSLPDNNGALTDLFLRDLTAGTTSFITLNAAATGSGAGGGASALSFSGDGSKVVFLSGSTDLTTQTNANGTSNDVFVRSLASGVTTLVSATSDGTATGNSFSTQPRFSADASKVVFLSSATNLTAQSDGNAGNDVFLRFLSSGVTRLVSINAAGTATGNGTSTGFGAGVSAPVSADSNKIAFLSLATDLTTQSDTNTVNDLFVRDVSPPSVLSITRLDANPTTATSLRYQVTFSESVTGVNPGSFSVARSAGISAVSLQDTSGGGAVYTVFLNGISGTGTLRVDVKAATGISNGTSALAGGFTGGETYTRNAGAGAAAASSGAILSEFRLRGPNGSGDEFVELYNTLGAPLQIGGWSVQTQAASGLQTTVVPQNTIVPARGHYLFTGGAFGLSGYGQSDALLSGDALDNSGVALFNAETTPVKQDAVGFTGSGATLKEGTALASAPTGAVQGSFTRLFSGTLPKDSNDNTADFAFVVSDGTSGTSGTPDVLATVAGTSGSVAAQLGAPSPQGLTSPTNINAGVTTILFDSGAGANVSPNRVRVGMGNSGTLLIRRTLLNKTGREITKIRFSVTKITSLGTPVTLSNQADVRLVTSGDTLGVSTSSGPKDVFGTTLEAGGAGQPAQPLGGALGSSVIFNLGTPLPVDGSRSYSFLLSIKKSGNFAVSLNIEALPNP